MESVTWLSCAQVDAKTGRSVTFVRLKAQALRFAEVLHKRGVGKGDRVALCLSNCLEIPVMWLALLSLGATTVLCTPGLTAGLQIIMCHFSLKLKHLIN